jgi:thermostable 8-oxoguanine DNA glycosylase
MNPARQHFRNIIEPENGSGNKYFKDFDENCPDRIFTRIAQCIKTALHRAPEAHRIAWHLRNIGDRSTDHMAVEDIAMLFTNRTAEKVSRWIARVNDELEQVCIERGLLPAEIARGKAAGGMQQRYTAQIY